MSMNYPPGQFYQFPTPGQALGQWITFDPTQGPLEYTVANGLSVGYLWFPVLTNNVQIFSGLSSVLPAVPFYTTGAGGAEGVPMPSNLTSFTLAVLSSSGAPMPVFVSNLYFDPVKTTPSGGVITGINVTAPLISSGSAAPTLSLQTPLPVVDGGTGQTAPSLVPGAGISISGSWPNQIISASVSNVLNNGALVTNPIINTGFSNTGASSAVTIASACPTAVLGVALAITGIGFFVNYSVVGLNVTFSSFNSATLVVAPNQPFSYTIIGH